MGPFSGEQAPGWHHTFDRGTLRERLIPMVAEVMDQVHWQGLQMIAWDVVMLHINGQIVAGVMIAVRGVDLAGPMKELVRFEPLRTWQPDQNTVNRCVATCVEGLREFRQSQARGANGPHP